MTGYKLLQERSWQIKLLFAVGSSLLVCASNLARARVMQKRNAWPCRPGARRLGRAWCWHPSAPLVPTAVNARGPALLQAGARPGRPGSGRCSTPSPAAGCPPGGSQKCQNAVRNQVGESGCWHAIPSRGLRGAALCKFCKKTCSQEVSVSSWQAGKAAELESDFSGDA